MQNFIAQTMRKHGLAPANKGTLSDTNPTRSGGGDAPLQHMRINGKWSYSTLEYPEDIQTRSDLGHYMMFYINVADSPNSQYSTYDSMKPKVMRKTDPRSRDRGGEEKQILNPDQQAVRDGVGWSKKSGVKGRDNTGNSWTPGETGKVIERKPFQGELAKRFKRNRTKRTKDAIILYQPPNIQVNHNATYKSNEMGGMVMETGQRIQDMVSRADSVGWLDAAIEAIPGFGQQAGREALKVGAKIGSELMGGDIMAGVDKLGNRAENKFKESTFQEVPFRKFSYTWKFTAKSPTESETIHDIIKTFKFHMLPELPEAGDYGRYFVVPAEFDIFYMFRGDENEWVNKISTCVLTNMDVNYSPGSYQTFRPISGKKGAPPIEIDMKLDFMETQLITKAEVLKG